MRRSFKGIIWLVCSLSVLSVSGCTAYKAGMEQAKYDPIQYRLPKMQCVFTPSTSVHMLDAGFVERAVRSEIETNIMEQNGPSMGILEVKCERVQSKSGLFLPILSGITLWSANLLGMPFNAGKLSVDLSFVIKDLSGNIIREYDYSRNGKWISAIYYGEDASVRLLELCRSIMNEFKEDLVKDYSWISGALSGAQSGVGNSGYGGAAVSRDNPGMTDLENVIIRWAVDSDPQGARVFWRVISNVPQEVKNTNETYLMTTPYEETRPFNILGLTYENSTNVQIEIKITKRGYADQVKRFNVRQAIDQQEISTFFELVPEDF
ncbi:MAG TPA: hypothetical protein IAC34_06970 [Candidatus Coprenecus stercoripullorum]|nr:hypothetical protein [Candidatus Coprenecus stercoripullorum]